MTCVIKTDQEYQKTLKQSGIPDNQLEVYVSYFLDKHGRYPRLDEIPSDSKPYIVDKLGIKKDKFVSEEKLKQFTLEEDISKIQQKLNTIFLDKDIKLVPFEDGTYIIKMQDRPSIFKHPDSLGLEINNPNSFTFFVDGLYRMANQYGINFKVITNRQLENSEVFRNIDAVGSKAFVYNGDIYINVDEASVDSPIHEMLHLLVGSMRFTNQNAYVNLLEYIQQQNIFQESVKNYPGRTINDASEEILINELSRLLSGQDSLLKVEQLGEVFYELRRNLDTLMLGNYSAGSIDLSKLVNMSFSEIGKIVESQRMADGMGSLSDAHIHRLTNNVKRDLMKKGELKQVCI